ncbi:MAG: homoserine kinase [Clostridia bacterium]|nr:homoserine kinase [Clostridia bacterium]
MNEITARAHATSANIGVMFDCGAIAIRELYTDVTFKRLSSGHDITISGYGSDQIPVDENNLAFKAVKEYLSFTGHSLNGFSVRIDNHIPFSGGLGSSAASIIATLAAVNACFENSVSLMKLLDIALKIEHHGDNLLACLSGGFTMYSEHSRVKNDISDSLRGVLTIPDYKVSTLHARKVLPVNYSRADSVKALQYASILTYGIISNDMDAIKQVLESDVIHEPFRSLLNRDLNEVRQLAGENNALGTTISGSGAAIISFVSKENQEYLYHALKKHFPDHHVIKISFINEGVTILNRYSCF